jgi:osmoprotectant transport system ATP-binding protein
LSGGERQRVGLARALAADPSLLLMDEPFGALDPITRSELHVEFKRLQAALRRAVVLVTHDMAEAFALGDRVAVLFEGRIIACDTPAVLRTSSDPRVAALVATRPVPPKPPRERKTDLSRRSSKGANADDRSHRLHHFASC